MKVSGSQSSQSFTTAGVSCVGNDLVLGDAANSRSGSPAATVVDNRIIRPGRPRIPGRRVRPARVDSRMVRRRSAGQSFRHSPRPASARRSSPASPGNDVGLSAALNATGPAAGLTGGSRPDGRRRAVVRKRIAPLPRVALSAACASEWRSSTHWAVTVVNRDSRRPRRSRSTTRALTPGRPDRPPEDARRHGRSDVGYHVYVFGGYRHHGTQGPRGTHWTLGTPVRSGSAPQHAECGRPARAAAVRRVRTASIYVTGGANETPACGGSTFTTPSRSRGHASPIPQGPDRCCCGMVQRRRRHDS